ncbi:hypothetical protein M378DRAFT_76759 [Amanita muscaria Koide BX008]|uniref:VLRF1 domain-containing protein n=1 Tax=Amanita muscaria (strain Koide BX008) TaxID=946122 RepID=A0A0C2SQL0_AMAMK|nr:hypothetical protein M378DRAFT_76759 [Amanita muscaria Koide BX008]
MAHIFALPHNLLDDLRVRALPTLQPPPPPQPLQPPPSSSSSTSLACNVCLGITFTNVDDLRAHARSDWHRYNVKSKLAGGKPVDEPRFAQLVNALDDSLSGSASSSDEDDDDSDAVNALVNKTKKLLKPVAEDDDDDSHRHKIPLMPIAWFHSPPSTQIGIYRSIFPSNSEPDAYLDQAKAMQSKERRTWALFMTAGGHFAGAIVRVSRSEEEEKENEGKKKKQPTKPDNIQVLRHKTFHRYTTRRKQGGSQSVNDNAKGAATSAGATLRRYGEQALRDDIRNLLAEWAEDIDACERIWIRASVSNRRIFLDYEDAIIHKRDERLRTFPFPTRRPTQSELQRCLLELTRAKVTHFTEDELKAQDEAYLASLPRPKPPPPVSQKPEPEKHKPKPPKLTKEEEALREKWTRLLDMVSKGRLDPLKTFWEREGDGLGGVNVTIPEWTGEKKATLLQVAAQDGHEDMTQWLLEDLRADPTIPVPNSQIDGDGNNKEGSPPDDAAATTDQRSSFHKRTAYDLARVKAVRDVFRRCAGVHPEWWDWFGAARVPSALSKEMEEERDDKKKIRRKGLKEKVREREAKEREHAPPSPPPVVEVVEKEEARNSSSTARRLGGTSGAIDAVEGLSPEMRARVERERRARAAEARLGARGR